MYEIKHKTTNKTYKASSIGQLVAQMGHGRHAAYDRWSNSGKAKFHIGTGDYEIVQAPDWLHAAMPSQEELDDIAEQHAQTQRKIEEGYEQEQAQNTLIREYAYKMETTYSTLRRILFPPMFQADPDVQFSTPEKEELFHELEQKLNLMGR